MNNFMSGFVAGLVVEFVVILVIFWKMTKTNRKSQMAMKNLRSFRFGPFWFYRTDTGCLNFVISRNRKKLAGFTFYQYKKNEDRNHSGIEVSVKMGNFYRVFNIKSPF